MFLECFELEYHRAYLLSKKPLDFLGTWNQSNTNGSNIMWTIPLKLLESERRFLMEFGRLLESTWDQINEILDAFLEAKLGQQTRNLRSGRRNVRGPWGEQ